MTDLKRPTSAGMHNILGPNMLHGSYKSGQLFHENILYVNKIWPANIKKIFYLARNVT
jgi:hypothetical protein